MTKAIRERLLDLRVPQEKVTRALYPLVSTDALRYVLDNEDDARAAPIRGMVVELVELWETSGAPELDAYERGLLANELQAARDRRKTAEVSARIAARNARKRALAEECRALREGMGFSTREMAAATGVPHGTIAHVEQTANHLSVERVEAIAEMYRDRRRSSMAWRWRHEP